MRPKLLAAATLTAVLALAGCGSTSLDGGTKKGDGAGKVTVDEAAAALVPQAIKDKGKLTVGTDASYAPSEFLDTDGKTAIGFDIDLFNAVAAKLGLKVDWQPASFDSIIGGVTSGKYDVGVSSFTVNTDREKQVDMIGYFSAGTQWASAAGNPKGVDPNNACGFNVAVQTATVQDTDDLPAKLKACGDNPFKVVRYEKQDEATAAVAAGKADAMLADSPVVAYAVQQSGGKLEALGDIYDAAPYGYTISKDNADLSAAIVKALQSLKADGGYEKALAAWGVTQGGIADFAINPVK